MSEEELFELWFQRRRQETWTRACAADRGPAPSTAWSMGLRGYLLEGWMARAELQAPVSSKPVACQIHRPVYFSDGTAPTVCPFCEIAQLTALSFARRRAAEKAESLLTAANAVLAHFMPSFTDSRAVDDCLVQLAAAVADVEMPAPETDWRHKAYEWLRAKAAEQEKTNAQYPRHAAEYPSWRDRVVWLRLLADQVLQGRLPIEENVAALTAETYEQIGVLRQDGEFTTYEGCEGDPVYIRTAAAIAEPLWDGKYTMPVRPPMMLVDGQATTSERICLHPNILRGLVLATDFQGDHRACPDCGKSVCCLPRGRASTHEIVSLAPQCNGNCYVIGGGFISDDPACPKHGSPAHKST